MAIPGAPQMPMPTQAPPSVAAQALRGGSPAQVQAYLQALKAVGAGGNNAQMASGPRAPVQAPTLATSLAGYTPYAGSASYAGGFSGGPNGVDYNLGLGARNYQGMGGTVGTTSGWGSGVGSTPGAPTGPVGTMQPTNYNQQVFGGGTSNYGVSGIGYGSQLGYGNSGSQPTGQYQIPPPGGGSGAQAAMQFQQLPQQAPQSTSYAPTVQAANGAADMASPAPTSPAPTSAAPRGMDVAMSDETAKTDVGAADESLRRFLDTFPSKHSKEELQEFVEPLGAHEYAYKNPKHGEGRFVSPMAQEFEKSSIGRQMIRETPEGKMVDYAGPRAEGVGFAIDAMHHEEIGDLKKDVAKLYAQLGAMKKRRGRG